MPEDRARYDEFISRTFHYEVRYSHRFMPWHEREHQRQFQRPVLVWWQEDFWRQNQRTWAFHFPYISDTDPTLLAYTISNAKGEADVQTLIKPGRYLMKYFKNHLTEKQIAYYAAWQATGAHPPSKYDSLDLRFATTADEIARVYKLGPYSCMSGYDAPDNQNAVRSYAAGDLAVAYLEGDAPVNQLNKSLTVLARAVVWPEKKVANRVYPTASYFFRDGFEDAHDSASANRALYTKLKAEGYKFTFEGHGGSLRGARLTPTCPTSSCARKCRTFSHHCSMRIPYIDGHGADFANGQLQVV